MAYADLVALGGVGILSLFCLAVCGVYVHRSSDSYRDRQRRVETQISGAQPPGQHDEWFSGTGVTVGTQLSQRCKTSMYRAVFRNAHDESIVFLSADNRDDARKRAIGALAAIHGIAAHDVAVCNLASFRELVDIGVSEDEDLRVFELAWKGADVVAWVEHPLFLTNDPGLLGKWAELYADLARGLAVVAIDRARG